MLVISTGGALADRAKEAGFPVWQFAHEGQPRAAVGYSFGLILGALSRLGLVPDASEDIAGAVQAMKSQGAAIVAESPVSKNPAKRLAGQLVGRWVTVFGAGILAPVARRWKGQINEVAKAVANYEAIPEADHNTLAGVLHPEEVIPPHVISLFLRAPSDHPRNRLRLDMTRQNYMLEGLERGQIYRERRFAYRAYLDGAAFWRLHGLLSGDGLWRGPNPRGRAGEFESGLERKLDRGR